MKNLLVPTITLLLAACGSSSGGEVTVDALAADGARADATPQADGAAGGNPIGTWAMRRVLTTTSTAPFIGPTTTTTLTLSRLDIVAAADNLAASDDVCGVSLESSSSLAVPSLVPTYPATIPTIGFPGHFEGGVFTMSPPIDVRGCTLTDEHTDALPTEAADARVVDEDADTHPGLTVRLQITGLGAQEVYVVQRLDAVLRADSVGVDRISGPMDVTTFEQNVIGASNSALASSPDVAVDAPTTTFTMVRVAAGTSCDDVLAAGEATLFGAR